MKISNLIVVVILLFFCFSCDNQEDNFKQYLTETVYPGKADSIRSYIGIEKVYLAWEAPTDAKAERMVVKYSDVDSIISETIIDTIVVTGLSSGDTYNFEVFSLDDKNNQSIKLYADLFPVSNDWVSKNMFIAKPQIAPTDGLDVSTLDFTWAALDNDVMKYKDGLEFTLTDDQGNEITSGISVENNVEGGRLVITVPDLDVDRSYTIAYKMIFSPIIDNKVILDTAPLTGEVTFVPSDFSLAPIYMLVESKGWDENSFVKLFALEPGRYIAQNITLEADDVIRIFEDESLTSEVQYGFSYFNTVPDLISTSSDGNDNLQLAVANDGVFDLIVETTSKAVSIGGTYNGLIQIPGVLEAEYFNIGGQGVSYNDGDIANRGGDLRLDESVDVDSGPAGNFNIGWTGDGEWLIYKIEVLETGTYQVDASMGANASPGIPRGQLAIIVDDVELTYIEVDGTGGWQTYVLQPANGNIQLEAGIHELRVLMRTPAYNFNSLTFTKL